MRPKEPTKVLIFAGGLGTRLRKVVNDRPKPMAEVKGRPFLEYLILYFKAQGFSRFLLSVGYKSGIVEDYFGGGAKWGVDIEYAVEREPLGTGGALMNARKLLSSPALVCNGDTLIEAAADRLIKFHAEKRSDWTIAVRQAAEEIYDPVGGLSVENGRIVNIGEKGIKRTGEYMNGGLYCISPESLDGIALAAPFSLEYDLLPKFIEAGGRVDIFQTSGFFCDIGTPESYRWLNEHGVPGKLCNPRSRHDNT